ncbi:MAG: hypothetical protein ACM3U1_03050 [Chloroflexota bacterium]
MNVTEIKLNPTQVYEKPNFRVEPRPTKPADSIQDTVQISQTANSWQKDILLNALESLENSIQPANSHPLGKLENRPIENFDQALAELDYLHSEKFASEASPAQANIDHAAFLSLFGEDVG